VKPDGDKALTSEEREVLRIRGEALRWWGESDEAKQAVSYHYRRLAPGSFLHISFRRALWVAYKQRAGA